MLCHMLYDGRSIILNNLDFQTVIASSLLYILTHYSSSFFTFMKFRKTQCCGASSSPRQWISAALQQSLAYFPCPSQNRGLQRCHLARSTSNIPLTDLCDVVDGVPEAEKPVYHLDTNPTFAMCCYV